MYIVINVLHNYSNILEKSENTKWVIRSRKSEDGRKMTQKQTMVDKTLNRYLKLEQLEPHEGKRWRSGKVCCSCSTIGIRRLTTIIILHRIRVAHQYFRFSFLFF